MSASDTAVEVQRSDQHLRGDTAVVGSAGLLESWLGPLSLDQFRARHLLPQTTMAMPGTAAHSVHLLDWQVLDRVLRAGPDTLVVAKGKLLDEPAPRSLAQLRTLMDRGIGLCVRQAERHDEALAGVAAAFEVLGPAQVQLFVTPAGTHGFGWHYDDEDVFIAQTAGSKDYYLRRNTVAAQQAARPSMFARYARETAPLCAATLIAGDFLYVPARWWHMAVCGADALSISVGVRTRRAGAPG
jgi:hypothetical protein